MTCAIGIRTPQGIVLAADSRCNYENEEGDEYAQDSKDKKVFRPRRWLAWAFAGEYPARDELLTLQWPDRPRATNLEWMVREMKPLLPKLEKTDLLFATMGTNGVPRLFQFDMDGPAEHEVIAIGMGEVAALGAYRALRRVVPGMTMLDLVRNAVRASSKTNISVGGRIHTTTIRRVKKERKLE